MTSDAGISGDIEVANTDALTQSGCSLLRDNLGPDSDIQLIKPLSGGRSGAEVWLCDVSSPTASATRPSIDGQYVLKVSHGAEASNRAANTLAKRLGDYANEHVPQMLLAASAHDINIELYDLAGGSLDTVRTAESVSDHLDRDEVHRRLAPELLRAQLVGTSVEYDSSVTALLEEWLGTNWMSGHRGVRLTELSRSLNPGQSGVFRHGAELLPDPMLVLCDATLGDQSAGSIRGVCHGDLHERNILVRGSRQTSDLGYWIIDFSWERAAPLLYDQAYLECSLVLSGLTRMSNPALATVLARIDEVEPAAPAPLDLAGSVLVHRIRSMRHAVETDLLHLEERRVDLWKKQLLLARVAAALNWASKRDFDPENTRGAYLIAAWHLRGWLRSHASKRWRALVDTPASALMEATPREIMAETEILRLWSTFQLANTGRDLFLIAEPVRGGIDPSPIERCAWSAVIDLDYTSDEDGLASIVTPKLRLRRHVSVFGTNVQTANPRQATNWLMANGWKSHTEAASETREEWRRSYFRRVRDLIDLVADVSLAGSAAVLVLRSNDDDTISSRIVEYIDEAYKAAPNVLTLNCHASSVGGIDAKQFFDVVRTSLSQSNQIGVATLPTTSGPMELSREDLLRLEVDLEVLHSAKLIDESDVSFGGDDFWRGRPPTWGELDAKIDLPRDAYPKLRQDILEALDPPRLAQITLYHSPGAGGTTLGRRTAWDLHISYPTVRLRTYTESTAERIDELFRRTSKPVVVLAEASDLQPSDRDELFEKLRERGTAAVVLLISRSTGTGQDRHQLIDPMSVNECNNFLRAYLARGLTNAGVKRLTDLRTSLDGDLPNQYRSPFYIGLCAYDETFLGIDRYVDHHLPDLDLTRRRVAIFLALITRYAQFPLPLDIIRRWLNADRPAHGEMVEALEDLLGSNLRHLVVASSTGARLLHPLIAERVLESEYGGGRQGLSQISDYFIRSLHSVLGSSSVVATKMLSNLFVRRAPISERAQRKGSFAEVIQKMAAEGGQLVFETLTDLYPREPHFWNHRGRYHIYIVKGDFSQAESYLITAVEKAGAHASLHQHTLGMVRRFWIEKEVGEILAASNAEMKPADLLARIRPLYDSAIEAFAECRPEMNTDHGLVTPLQLISFVIGSLVTASKQPSLTALLATESETTDWIAEQLDEAESLLDELRAASLDGRSRHKYYDRLTQEFDLLYGDIEALVEQWRAIKTTRGDDDSSELGLALARIIFAQTGRDWSDVSVTRAREITAMLWESVSAGASSDSDLRLWLQAYRRLPEYSETIALERLSAFAESGSLDAYFYLYVMNFMIWLRGDAQSQDRTRLFLEECRRLARNKNRAWSYEWVGLDDQAPPLVHFTELGPRDPGPDGFFSRPYLLGRLRGVIERIDGRQAGIVRVTPGNLTAFFVPRLKFLQTRDVNATVDFFLGFSYDGLKAWELEYPGKYRGPSAVTTRNGTRTFGHGSALSEVSAKQEDRDDSLVEMHAAAHLTPVPARQRTEIDPSSVRSQLKGLQGDEAYKAAVEGLLAQCESNGMRLDSLRLGEALQSILGHAGYKQMKGMGNLRAAIARLGFATEQGPGAFYVLRSERS